MKPNDIPPGMADGLPNPDDSHVQTEFAVLSILIAYPDAFDAVSDTLTPALFLDSTNRVIYAELARQLAAGKPVSIFTLSGALGARVSLAELHAIATCHDHNAQPVKVLADLLLERHKKRELHRLAVRLSEVAFDPYSPVQNRIDEAMTELQRLDEAGGNTDDWVGSEQAAMAHLEVIDRRESGVFGGIQTGLVDLDYVLDGGMQRGNLLVIGARPAMGKTALSMTIGLHVARAYSAAMFSMEMPHADLRDRQLAIMGRINLSALKRPKVMGLDYSRVVDAVEASKPLRWWVSDKSGLNILQLRSRTRMVHRKHGLDVLIVDYIGLMAGMNPRENRNYQIEEISRGLKALAKELDIAVVCLAQVNRGAMERVNTVPGLHDLRDSGAIEQDSDVVMFIHRPIVANPQAGEQFTNYALLRVAKNRQGRTGDVHLHYQGEYTRFDAWAGPIPTATGSRQTPAKKGFIDDDL